MLQLLILVLMIIITVKAIMNEGPRGILSGRQAAESTDMGEEFPWVALASNRGFVLVSLLLLLPVGPSAMGALLDFLSVLAMATVGQKVMV